MMAEMPRPPLPLLAYVAKWTAIGVVALATAADEALVLAGTPLRALLLLGLWRGHRAAWALLLVVETAITLAVPLEGVPWWASALGVVALVLLLAPASRRHVGLRRAGG